MRRAYASCAIGTKERGGGKAKFSPSAPQGLPKRSGPRLKSSVKFGKGVIERDVIVERKVL